MHGIFERVAIGEVNAAVLLIFAVWVLVSGLVNSLRASQCYRASLRAAHQRINRTALPIFKWRGRLVCRVRRLLDGRHLWRLSDGGLSSPIMASEKHFLGLLFCLFAETAGMLLLHKIFLVGKTRRIGEVSASRTLMINIRCMSAFVGLLLVCLELLHLTFLLQLYTQQRK